MTDQNADETIIVKYIVDAQDAITRANQFRANVNAIKDELKSLSSQSGRSWRDIAQGMKDAAKADFQRQINEIRMMGEAAKASKAQIQALVQPLQQAQQTRMTEINTALRETEAGSKNLGSSFGMLGTAIGTALGFGTYQLVAKFFGLLKDGVQWMKEAAQAGYDFAKAMFQVQIGVNALRRAGVDITFSQVYEQLAKLKKEFGIFSTTELVQGAAAFLNLNRDMGFTREQLFELQKAIATLAVVNGRSMEEVQRTVALALSSGYTEGLQRLGVSINRVTIAQEAANLGYADSYMALTEVQRAQATYNLVLEKTAVYAKDLTEYQKTMAGQIDTATAATTDFNREAGENLTFLKYWEAQFKKLWAATKLLWTESNLLVIALRNITRIITNWSSIFPSLIDNFNKTREANGLLGKSFREVGFSIQGIKDMLSGVITNYKEYWAEVQKILSQDFTVTEPDIIPKTTEPLKDDQTDAVNNVIKEIRDLEEQAAIDRRDALIDLQRDLAEIEENGAQERADIIADYNRKITQIAIQAAQDIADAELKYNLDVKQAWEDYYGNVEEANRKHSDKLLKIEEDYQEKLLRLREGFLLDLEDALQARDARQVLNLIRRYNLERTQTKRERDQNLKEEDRNYKDQLASLDRQREERLRKLKQEYELRLKMIEIQKQRELEAEKKAERAKLIQQMLDEQRRDIDRKERYKQELADMELHNQDRINAIAQGLIDAGITTQEGMDAVYGLLEGYIGEGGSYLSLWESYASAVRSILASIYSGYPSQAPQGTLGNWDVYSNSNTQPDTDSSSSKPVNKKARGGLEIATKPTMALYGEAGVPELHAFIPLPGGLGSLSSTSAPSPSKIPEMVSGGKGKAQVEIWLGAGLEGKIVDKTLDSVADIVLRRKVN